MFFWRFVVTRGVTFGFCQIKLLGTDWAIFLSTLQLLTNCETCIGSSSSLLWNVHKYHLVILKHGWTCGEGGLLWPSNRLHCPLCLWASTCKHSLSVNNVEHSHSFQILMSLLCHLNVYRLWLYITKAMWIPWSLSSQWMMLSFQILISFWMILLSPSGLSVKQLQQDNRKKHDQYFS